MEKNQRWNEISAQELKKWLEQGRDVTVIDPFPLQQYEQQHIPGAKNVCVYQVSFPQDLKEVVPDLQQEVVIYSATDLTREGTTAAEKMERMGYQNITLLKGGLASWVGAGYPMEGKEPMRKEDEGPIFAMKDALYHVDTGMSVIEWAGRNPNGKHQGTLKLSKGQLTVKGGEVGGSFEIDMTSIKNRDLEGDALQPILVAHLLSDDFFFVKMFPKASFTIQSAQVVDEPTLSSPNFSVLGVFEMLGIRREIQFLATVNSTEDGGISAEAHFDIDRTQWNVIYGSSRFFRHLGMHLVYDLISLDLRIVARPG